MYVKKRTTLLFMVKNKIANTQFFKLCNKFQTSIAWDLRFFYPTIAVLLTLINIYVFAISKKMATTCRNALFCRIYEVEFC